MLTAKNLGYEQGGRTLFSGVNFSVNPGEKVGLVGRNGVGKSTVLKILSGELEPTSGEVQSAGLEVGRLPQDLNDWLDVRIYDFLQTVTGTKDALQNLEQAGDQLAADPNSTSTLLLYQDALDRAEHLEVFDFDSRLAMALRKAGIDDLDPDLYIDNLSGGQRSRVAMAAVLAAKHDIVLLDEPTNNLDSEGIVLLERYMNNSRAGFLVVSHDRRFLRNATTRILDMLGGDQGVVSYGLGYDEYVEARERAREAAFKRYEEYEQERTRLSARVRDLGQSARQAASSRRTDDNDKLNHNFRTERAGSSLAGRAKAMEARLGQLEEPDRPLEDYVADFAFDVPEKDRSDIMVSVRDVKVTYQKLGGEQLVLGPFNLTLGYGERVAITGPNGSGKSSLLKAIFEKSTAIKGDVQLSPNLKHTYIDQNHTLPNAAASAVDNVLALVPGADRSQAFNQLVRLGVERDVIQSTAANASPGERSKILLAAAILNRSNLIVLDEPTNHLDIPTIEGLEKALKAYKGTLLVVSHDRDFIDTIGVSRQLKV